MSGLFRFYDNYFLNLGAGVHTYPADTLKLALLQDSYAPCSSYGTRDGLVSYTAGDVIYSSAYECYFVASSGGVSALGAPIFDTVPGASTADGTVTWVSVGLAPPSAHTVLADIVAHEISGTGYTAGGVTVTYTHTLENRRVLLRADDATWMPSTLTAKYAALYKSGTVGAITNPLIGYVLLDTSGVSLASTAGVFKVRFGNNVVQVLGGW